MKHIILSTVCASLAMCLQLCAETLFGPGTIIVATNEAILINTIGPAASDPLINSPLVFQLDGNACYVRNVTSYRDARIAIAGPHTLTITNDCLVTFQRMQGSAIRTAILTPGTPGVVDVASGKTMQILYNGDLNTLDIFVRPYNSTNRYPLIFPLLGLHPAVTGPATIEFSVDSNWGTNTFVSYYLTDEVVQVPPSGFLSMPAPALEVNIEKSFNLTNWIPTGAFHTEAEAAAFYRLRMLK